MKMPGWGPEDAISLVSNNASHRRIASILRPGSPPDCWLSNSNFVRLSNPSLLAAVVVLPSV
jgi:hypothetical protein